MNTLASQVIALVTGNKRILRQRQLHLWQVFFFRSEPVYSKYLYAIACMWPVATLPHNALLEWTALLYKLYICSHFSNVRIMIMHSLSSLAYLRIEQTSSAMSAFAFHDKCIDQCVHLWRPGHLPLVTNTFISGNKHAYLWWQMCLHQTLPPGLKAFLTCCHYILSFTGTVQGQKALT